MAKLIEKFTTFLHGSLIFLLVIDVIVGIGLAGISIEGFNISVFVFGLIAILASFFGYKFINMNMSSRNKLLLILIIGFSLRVLWILNVNSIPTSDFKIIYDSAGSFINGDRSMFFGTSYIGRFPHLTITTLYMALIRYMFPISNLLVIKIINLICSMLVLILVNLIINALYKNKDYSLKGTLIGAIFPPFISYVGVFCSENLAMPLYLLSIYLFLVALKAENKLRFFILCGVTLAIGNLFRMIALIVLIAYLIYILIYYKDTQFVKIRKMALITVSYAIIICSVSSTLQALKITEYPLWKGSEPNITSVLKGTNYNSFGAWNEEDAKIIEENIDDYDKVEDLSKKIIKERLTSTSFFKLGVFYLGKFSLVWSTGDCSGVLWSQKDIDESTIKFPVKEIKNISIPLSTVFQIIYVLILMLVLLGLFNKNKLKNIIEINLFYLILCGYGCTYLITEAQPRYSYIVCWIFIILSINGLDYLKLFKNSSITYNESL